MLYEDAWGYDSVMRHYGHTLDIANYHNVNVAIECIDCDEVIVDYTYVTGTSTQ